MLERARIPALLSSCALLRTLGPLLLALLAHGCGQGGARLETAGAAYRAGNLEKAEELLTGDSSRAARELLEKIDARRTARRELELRLAEIESELAPREALVELERLARATDDPFARDAIGRVQSRTLDRRASEGAERPKQAASTAGVQGRAPSAPARPSSASATAARAPQSVASLPPEPGPATREAPTAVAPEPEPKAAEAPAAPGPSRLLLERAELLEAARSARPGDAREELLARALELERRALLREELSRAREREPEAFERLGIGLVLADELELQGRRIAFEELPLETLRRAAGSARLSLEAELGLCLERIARADLEGTAGGLAELARLVERGALDREAAWRIVARARGEELPEDGYVFDASRWIARAEHERALFLATLASLEKRLADASPATRDGAFDALLEQLPEARAPLESALARRLRDARASLGRGSTLAQLERVAEQRRELDRRRASALELIFDEETYFYPYQPPAVDADKARLYWPVQTRVDELVAAVREVWGKPREVKLASGFREALDELDWLRRRSAEAQLELPDSGELPAWIGGIDPRLESIALASFAWDERERNDLAYDRAVRERNERLWSARPERGAQRPLDESEAAQVRITNDYRALFGRRALAWNPLIQEAARMHSRYMADTGDFGHFQPDPERRTPGDRMRLCGYHAGISENCHMGGGGPQGAHEGWTHSSGHHRNLLMPTHREMASAVAGNYWTQDFGVDTAFQAELPIVPNPR